MGQRLRSRVSDEYTRRLFRGENLIQDGVDGTHSRKERRDEKPRALVPCRQVHDDQVGKHPVWPARKYWMSQQSRAGLQMPLV
jgi:hypothetical protein